MLYKDAPSRSIKLYNHINKISYDLDINNKSKKLFFEDFINNLDKILKINILYLIEKSSFFISNKIRNIEILDKSGGKIKFLINVLILSSTFKIYGVIDNDGSLYINSDLSLGNPELLGYKKISNHGLLSLDGLFYLIDKKILKYFIDTGSLCLKDTFLNYMKQYPVYGDIDLICSELKISVYFSVFLSIYHPQSDIYDFINKGKDYIYSFEQYNGFIKYINLLRYNMYNEFHYGISIKSFVEFKEKLEQYSGETKLSYKDSQGNSEFMKIIYRFLDKEDNKKIDFGMLDNYLEEYKVVD